MSIIHKLDFVLIQTLWLNTHSPTAHHVSPMVKAVCFKIDTQMVIIYDTYARWKVRGAKERGVQTSSWGCMEMGNDESKAGGKEGRRGGGWIDGWVSEWMNGWTDGGKVAGGRYATYWHRSTGGPIKERVTFMGPLTATAPPRSSRHSKPWHCQLCWEKLSLLWTTAEPRTFSL